MGAGGDEHDDVVGPDDGLQLVEQRRDHQVPRLRPGAVAHGDGDGLPGSDALAQRRADGRGTAAPRASAARSSGTAWSWRGRMTVAAPSGTSMTIPDSP